MPVMGGVDGQVGREDVLPYVPQLVRGWTPSGDDPRHMRVTGTLVFVDISGFTRLTERLARKGNVGAEEMSDLLSATPTCSRSRTRTARTSSSGAATRCCCCSKVRATPPEPRAPRTACERGYGR
jgi:hypothetical protein